MANPNAVWGIEIGHSALKALRCRLVDGEVVAEGFDYIEYPKILSQPEADPETLVREALEKFLERNDTSGGTKIAMSVPGQSGLAKFFKPPPVEAKKISDIVRYEARQQIPFDLEDVIWDFQVMPGSVIEEGYALESEVGLFAMKREQAYRQLQPLQDAGLEVDMIQLTPLALYNMLAYDRMDERLAQETFDPENPPSSTVLLSIGTDSSDLIITNGFRIWQRSMPIGGNHFTRQLTKDLKLTFAKAEHLKRNAREAEDPKLVFQTMRPVFNDLVTELQRSIGFFKSIHKKAEISELLISGNTVKMPGLAQYLGKNLGYEVHLVDRFNRLDGEEVLTIPSFRDNAPTFGVCYGLALQSLGKAPIKTSLIPHEILVERMVRAKKPWALAAVAALLLGLTGHYFFVQRSWATTHPEDWQAATSQVDQAKSYSSTHTGQFDDLKARLVYLKEIGNEVSGNSERRLLWMEMQKAVMAMVPRTDYPDGKLPSPQEVPFEDRKDIYITSLDTRYYEDLSSWFDERRANHYVEEMRNWAKLTDNPLPESFDEGATPVGPEGPGWVIELRGYHDYNSTERVGFEGNNHIRRTLMHNFLTGQVQLPDVDGNLHTFTMQELGIAHPMLISDNRPEEVSVRNPDYIPPPPGTDGMGGYGPGGAGSGGYGGELGGSEMGGSGAMAEGGYGSVAGPGGAGPGEAGGEAKEPPMLKVRRQEFVFQLCWIETPLSVRLKRQQEAAEKAAEEAAQQAEEEGQGLSSDDVASNP